MREFVRDDIDVWAPDFNDVKLGTVVMMEKRPMGRYWYGENNALIIGSDEGDLVCVVELVGRPRVAHIRHLRTNKQFHVRVDELLELHDNELLTILPG